MNWILLLILFVVGLALSAFFSGSETGFYRASRIRLMLDALAGDKVARGLLLAIHNPMFFIATILVGNNLANYVVTLSVVLATEQMIEGENATAELIVAIGFSPIIFVYGELLPKYLYYHAPNRMLRRGGIPFFCCVVLFFPVVLVVWAFGWALRKLIGQSPAQISLMLARKELVEVLEEGHHVGLLRPVQRNLAQGLFAVANRPISDFVVPISRFSIVRRGTRTGEVLRLARRHRAPTVLVESADRKHQLLGYIRVIDLHLNGHDTVQDVRPLMEVQSSEPHMAVLMRMQSAGEPLARVCDDRGSAVGILVARRLTNELLQGG